MKNGKVKGKERNSFMERRGSKRESVDKKSKEQYGEEVFGTKEGLCRNE